MEYLRRASQHISKQGRGPDNALMHVTSNELQALGRLHPSGQLPRNPKTGLPEAGFLEDILPSIVGIGLNFIPGVGPLISAAASGLTSTAMTGDLGKGIMSGLLSYGAGSALNGLAGEGAAAASATTPAASNIGAESFNAATQSVGDLGSSAGASSFGLPSPAAPAMNLGGGLPTAPSQSLLQSANPFGSATSANPAFESLQGMGTSINPADLPFGLQPGMDPLDFSKMPLGDKLNAAATNLGNDPTGTLKRTFVDNAMRTSLPLGVGLVGSMGQQGMDVPKEPTSAELNRKYPEQFPDERRVLTPPSDYRPGFDPEFDYFEPMAAGGGVHGYYAKGGIADANPKASIKANIEAEAKMALLDHHPKAKEALRRYADMFGEDALRALTEKVSSMGGRIRGAGGGLDDLIPGTIEGRKEVRLADGEFVVPADVVSHLGDGSSDHGVRKLTEMMDRIRKVKTGTTKQAGHIKDKKVMPA